MIRRWFSVVLMVWAISASLIVTAAPALAANETYSVDANGNIVGAGPLNATFTANGGNYVYTQNLSVPPNACSITYTISGVAKGTGTNYNGNIATVVSPTGCSLGVGLNGGITIADPKNIAPGQGGATAPAPAASPAAAAATDPNAFACNGGSLTWLICPVLQAGVDAVDWIRDNILVPFLQEQPLSTASTTYTVWTHFRDVASVFFILIFILIVYGTAIGFDNYTIKKVMPHLIAGAILVPFSWYICVIGLDIGNVVGQGIVALCNSFIPAPTIDFTTGLSKLFLGTTAVLAGLALVTALTSFSFGLLFTILIAVLATLFTLILRKIMIILLVVISPFAFVAWILPNTQKLFKQWWTNLARMILMYPLIMLVFEAGRLFATTAGTIFGNGATGVAAAGQNAVVPLMQIAGLYLPLMVVPWTFSWAGGAMKLGAGAIGKVGSQLEGRYGKSSAGAKERREQTQKINADRSQRSNNAAVRAFARKRAGLGGGFLSEVPGLNKVPGVKMSGHAKQKINMAAESYANAEALSAAQDEDRKISPKSSKQNIESKTLAAEERIREARISEALLSKRNGVSLKDIDLNSGRTDASHKAIVDAAAKGDHEAHVKALSESGGIDQLEGIYRDAVTKGDQYTAIAASRRLSQSKGGFERMQQLANGRVVGVEDKDGNIVDFKGGNGEHFEPQYGMVADSNGQMQKRVVGAVHTGKAFLGGDDFHTVSDKNKDLWSAGTRDAKVFDQNKPLAAAASDNAPGDIAGMDAYSIKRALAFYARNPDNKGRDDFNQAAEKIFGSPAAMSQILPDTARAVASVKVGGVVNPTVAALYGARVGIQPAGAVPPLVAQAVTTAAGNDVHHIAQVQQAMQSNPTIQANIYNQVQTVAPGTNIDLTAAGVPRAPLATGEVEISPAIGQEIIKQLGNDFTRISDTERRYATDATYRNAVNDAYLFKRPIPPPI